MQYDQDKLAKALKAIPEIAFAYIFGSSQSGTVNEGSDIDVAVYLVNEDSSAENKANLQLIILKALEKSVAGFDNFDLLILNDSNSILGLKALQGKLLFVKPEYENVYADFYSYTCRKYEYDIFWMKKQLEYRGYEVQWDN